MSITCCHKSPSLARVLYWCGQLAVVSITACYPQLVRSQDNPTSDGESGRPGYSSTRGRDHCLRLSVHSGSDRTKYEVIAGYAEQHPRILPREFSDYRVEAGGRGAGTIISVKVTFLGGARRVRMAITEPEPGRVVAETDSTTQTVDAVARGSTVTIDTRFRRSGRLRGAAESLVAPRALRRLYIKELDLLAA